jgi:hypothetical protein
MDLDELVELHPRLYHMSDSTSWPGIKAHGLLSTSALLDLFQVEPQLRIRIEMHRRPEPVRLEHPTHGTVVIRDNKPVSDSKLTQCLTDGLTPSDWYWTLNGLVFFWLTPDRLSRLLAARAYRDQVNLILELDTAGLLAAHGGDVRLSPINSGSTAHRAVARGPGTFTSIEDYPFDQLRKRRTRSTAIGELAVAYSVPDVLTHLVSARLRDMTGEVVELV